MNHFAVPKALFTVRAQNPTYAFGSETVENGTTELSWAHFLSRDIAIHRDDQGKAYESDENTRPPKAPSRSLWTKCTYVLHVRRCAQPGSRTEEVFVTLLCFGAPAAVMQRFSQLLSEPFHDRICKQPFLLFETIYSELFVLVDEVAWGVTNLFCPIETSTLALASSQQKGTPGSASTAKLDFARLHNTSKHCIYVMESVEAAMDTLEAMTVHLESFAATTASTASSNVEARAALRYRQRTFQSTLLRLKSLEKRMANIGSLSFHLVAQHDSEIMRNDSAAMKVIAILTLVFLPATGVASVLSSPFFKVDFGQETQPLQVAASFKIFWIVVLPLTVGVVLFWWVWYTVKMYGRLLVATRIGRRTVQNWSNK